MFCPQLLNAVVADAVVVDAVVADAVAADDDRWLLIVDADCCC